MFIWLNKLLNKKVFRVKYPDGKISKLMHYKIAKNYKEIFGGEIIKD